MNNENSKHICLFIEPYAHINVINDNVLLYNTLNGEQLVYDNNPEIAGLLTRMMEPQNLNAVVISKTILEKDNFREFLDTGRKKGLLDWYSYSKKNSSHKKPIAMPALLNFHRDRKRMALDPHRDMGQDIIKYLHHLNIYINCYRHHCDTPPVLKEGYKQFLFPYSTKEYSELNLADFKRILAQVKDYEFCSITVLGGNIFQYYQLENLLTYLAQLRLKKELGLFYKDITVDNLKRVDWKSLSEISLQIFVEPQIEKNKLHNCIQLLNQLNIDVNYQFTIQSESEANVLGEYFDLLSPGRFSVNPFYNSNNYAFFRENVFIEKEDLSEPVVTKKDIYARSVMNPTAFGHLTILTNGVVHSNLYEKPIGTIRESVKQLISKEFTQGDGWFKLRKDRTPCGNCIYHQICPAISKYEYALSRSNMCWLEENAEGITDDR